jgi:hypothetical protein
MGFPKRHNNCNGCSWYMLGQMDLEHCSVCNKDRSCPCTECVVKPMCEDNVTCDKYLDWIELHGYTRDGFYKGEKDG